MKRKLMLHPGEVRAKDGDIHFIGAQRLIELYRVRPDDEVHTFDPNNRVHRWDDNYMHQFQHLVPRSDGGYYDIHAEDFATNPLPPKNPNQM